MNDIAKNSAVLQCVLEDLPQGTSAPVRLVKQQLLDMLQKHNKVEDPMTIEDIITISYDARTQRVEALVSDNEDIKRASGDGMLHILAYPAFKKFNAKAVLLQVK
jgi:hypothetical protein